MKGMKGDSNTTPFDIYSLGNNGCAIVVLRANAYNRNESQQVFVEQ